MGSGYAGSLGGADRDADQRRITCTRLNTIYAPIEVIITVESIIHTVIYIVHSVLVP